LVKKTSVVLLLLLLSCNSTLAKDVDISYKQQVSLKKYKQKTSIDKPKYLKLFRYVRTSRGGYYVRAKVTAYCIGKITASGKRVRVGYIAMPKEIPFRTRVYIPGYGYAVVEDRGGAVKIRNGIPTIDIYVKDYYTAKKWGVKYLDVLILH